jgi:hypothetical protein
MAPLARRTKPDETIRPCVVGRKKISATYETKLTEEPNHGTLASFIIRYGFCSITREQYRIEKRVADRGWGAWALAGTLPCRPHPQHGAVRALAIPPFRSPGAGYISHCPPSPLISSHPRQIEPSSRAHNKQATAASQRGRGKRQSHRAAAPQQAGK